jgi:hypothetical protein
MYTEHLSVIYVVSVPPPQPPPLGLGLRPVPVPVPHMAAHGVNVAAVKAAEAAEAVKAAELQRRDVHEEAADDVDVIARQDSWRTHRHGSLRRDPTARQRFR